MPHRKRVLPLRQLCISSVSKNIDFWCKDYIESFGGGQNVLYIISPFDCLPQSVLDDLFTHLKNTKLLRKSHLDLIINSSTTSLDFSRASDISVPHAIKLIIKTCKNLTHLDLSFCIKVSQDGLKDLCRSIPNITSLNLQSTVATDAVLSVLGANCPKLMELNVSWCPVTDIGISALCTDMDDLEDANLNPKCRLLQKLFVSGTTVSDKGALIALKCFPFLRLFDYANTFRVLSAINDEKKSKFKIETLSYNSEPDVSCFNDAIDVGVVSCPNVTKVTLVDVTINPRGFFNISKFEELSELVFVNGTENVIEFSDVVLPLLNEIGKRLVLLSLDGINEINLWSIGINCPHLQQLDLVFNTAYYSPIGFTRQKIDHKMFADLRELKLVCNEENDIPSDQLREILTNCTQIINIFVQRCQSLSDELLKTVFVSNSFSKLTHLELEYCNTIHQTTLYTIMDLSDSLSGLNMWWCDGIRRSDYQALKSYVDRENLDTKLEWAGITEWVDIE